MYETESERAELRGFVIEVGRTLQSHSVALHRHEENFNCAFDTASSHRDGIEALRKNMLEMSEMVNAQSGLLASMQKVLVRIVTELGMEPPAESGGALN